MPSRSSSALFKKKKISAHYLSLLKNTALEPWSPGLVSSGRWSCLLSWSPSKALKPVLLAHTWHKGYCVFLTDFAGFESLQNIQHCFSEFLQRCRKVVFSSLFCRGENCTQGPVPPATLFSQPSFVPGFPALSPPLHYSASPEKVSLLRQYIQQQRGGRPVT